MKIFSIIICTQNPAKESLLKLFDCIQRFDRLVNEFKFEILFIDSNSSIPLNQNAYVKEFLKNVPVAKYIRLNTNGLTNARIAGIEVANGDWGVFFDDDNLPQNDYLLSLLKLINKHPEVGIWGSGKISVKYDGLKVESNFLKNKKVLFQERDLRGTHFARDKSGSIFYPPGSGMIIHLLILKSYVSQVQNKVYTMSDRNGNSLISGGDVQIILHGIKMGYFVGSSSDLKLTHLINCSKLKYKKILNLQFWLSSSSIRAFNEVFPESAISLRVVTNKDVVFQLYYFLKVEFFHLGFKEGFFQFSRRMGEFNANIIASKSLKQPFLLKTYQKIISI